MMDANYILYKLSFTTPVHFGKNKLNESEGIFSSDRLFSAIYQELINLDGVDEKEMLEYFKNGNLQISDAFAYVGDDLLVPKPRIPIVFETKNAKILKKIEFLPFQMLDDFLKGSCSLEAIDEINKKIGKSYVVQKLSKRENKDPFTMGVYQFYPNAGLYFILKYEDEFEDYSYCVDDALQSLAVVGIGGKCSSGYGRFKIEQQELDPNYATRIDSQEYSHHMLLSFALPNGEELTQDLLEGASTKLERKGGFIQSTTYSNTMQKKKDLFGFSNGSTFLKRFDGDIYDVSGNGNHPVYRYAKGLFLGFDYEK